ncbi:uncharacterized protein TNCV_5058701 [Trichonephila clavipes]|nr:uncharacterized protein TNCV_5058701 [Trichonephila clavipes]
MGHEDELTTEELQEILNEETHRNVPPSEQEEDVRGPMPTSAIKDLLKKWVDVKVMVLEWHPNQADVSRVGDFYNDNAINYFRKILKNRENALLVDGYVNKQNCRIWSEANPQVYVETPLHPEKLTVWCALWAGGIIGPYFKNDKGHNGTINGDRYRAMITNFFIPELNNHDVQELWFQQDGAT